MKKINKILTVAMSAGLLSVGIAAASVKVASVKKVSAESTHFTFGALGDVGKNGTSGDFTFVNNEGCEANPGRIGNKDSEVYWGENHFNSFEDFFIGESYGWAGKMRSATWIQDATNKYVYFTWTGNDQIINIYTSTNELVVSLTNDVPNGNSMVVNFIEIPAAYLTGSAVLYLELVDEYTNDDGYRFSNFGYLHINASATEVADAIWEHVDTVHYRNTNEEKDRYNSALNTYSSAKYRPITPLATADRTNVDESFDSQEHFLANWTRDASYDENVNLDHINDVISTATHHYHEKQPFNKTGGFFKGYYEASYSKDDFSESETKGFGVDNFKYRFVSKPFVLSGTGFVSIKMSGHSASFHVLRGTQELAFVDNKANSRQGTNTNITTGYNALTMVRHVINLNAFKGQIIQLAFADVNTDGDYGAINVDELISYYSSYPTIKVDTVTQGTEIHHYYVDKYVPMTNSLAGTGGIDYKNDDAYPVDATTDTSPVQEAYTFLSSFYSQVRINKSGENVRPFSWCDDKNSYGSLIEAYDGLGSEAREVVDASEDFHYGDLYGNLVEGDYWKSTIYKGFTVGQTMNAIKTGVYPVPNGIGFLAPISSDGLSYAIIIIVSCSVILASLLFYVVKKHKKQK